MIHALSIDVSWLVLLVLTGDLLDKGAYRLQFGTFDNNVCYRKLSYYLAFESTPLREFDSTSSRNRSITTAPFGVLLQAKIVIRPPPTLASKNPTLLPIILGGGSSK